MNGNSQTVYSVSQVNQYLKQMMDRDELLSAVLVRGEISNYKLHGPTGHHYFSMKDENGSIPCVLYRGDAVRLRFQLQNGMKVIAFGRVSVYPRDGKYQLYCRELMPEGIGDLHAAFEAMKARLLAEGLFDERHKKPLPPMPKRIALVTSGSGKAVHDMLRVLGERWPMAQVVIVPVKVQGEGAASEIAAGIRRVNREELADLIITGRGGGSMEDLWAFNEEPVARAIYDSELPVISAVGHEPDVTIADYVADVRAATPSNAAELAVPDQQKVREHLDSLNQSVAQAVQRQLVAGRAQLERLSRRPVLTDLKEPIEIRRRLLDGDKRRVRAAFQQILSIRKAQMGRLAASLDALSPLRVLARGYSIAQSGGTVVTGVDQVQVGDALTLRLEGGRLDCTVTGKESVSS